MKEHYLTSCDPSQPLSKLPLVTFNKAACEFQAGLLEMAVDSAESCVEHMKERERVCGGNVLNLSHKERELIISGLQL